MVLKIVLSENINALDEVTVVALSANQIVSRAIANLEERWLANAMVTKKYGKITFTLNTDVSFDNYQQIINNEVFKNKNRS